MVSRLLFFTLQLTTILSIASSSCINEPFSFCGIGYLKYPFWGGSRGPHCGHQGFHITCDTSSSGGAGVPILNISSLPYKLSSLDFSTNTLRVVRQDFQFQNEACPNQLLRNTTLDIRFFEFPTNSTDRNLTLFLDCRGDGVESLPNKFKCNSTINLFTIAEASAGPGAGVSCRSSIFIPVNEKDAVSLEDPSASSVNILRSALAAGFSIQWLNQSIDPPPRHAPGYLPVQSPGKAPPRFSETLKPGNGRKKWRSPGKVIALVVALTGIGVIILIIVVALNRRQANTPNPESKKEVENFLLKHGSITPKRFRYSEIKKMTKSFSDKLGQGGYGSVYKGMLSDGSPVAVKILFQTDSNGEEFVNEVASISRTSHVNIVTLLGFCYEGSKRALVYEFMPNNSLDKFLNQSLETMDRCLSLEQLYKIAVGTAKGLEYLHTGCTTRIVHFDIKPQNILLDEEFTPKISDFGLAKLCKKKQSILSSMLGTRGTVGYIAPEVFSRNFGGVSHKSDVYSYGMMLLEMVGARKVTEAEANQSSENYFPDRIYEEVITEVVIEEGEEEERRKMILIGFWCIQTMSSSRPSMSKVVEMLEGSVSSIQIPPKPFLFSPNRSSHQVSSTLSAYVETQDSAEY